MPCSVDSRRTAPSQEDRATQRPLVAVAEPSSVLFRSCSARLHALGVETVRARGAIDLLRTVVERSPRAVVVSRELADLPAAAVLQALRASAAHRAIPIAVTTSDEEALEERSQESTAFDATLLKDSRYVDRVEAFLRDMGVPCAGSPGLAAKLLRDGASVRILLAEDTAAIHRLLARFLHASGADVVVVENGLEAVRQASGGRFDLILMDLEMPELDGRAACKLLRAQGLRAPILALSAHEAQSLRKETALCGFTGLLSKPITREALVDACVEALGQTSAAA